MLEPGASVPDLSVWNALETPVPVAEALSGGLVLLCFYLWDWSPT